MNEQIKLTNGDVMVPGRKLTAQELADLSDEWENPTVDTSKYYQCVVMAWEVTKEGYLVWKRAGGLCQERRARFYIA